MSEPALPRPECTRNALCRCKEALSASLGANAGVLLMGSVFAVVGWFVTYIVENVVSVPTVEYAIDLAKNDSGRITVTVRNISRDHKFSTLKFILRLPQGGSGKFMEATIEPIQPAYPPRNPIKKTGLSISYPAIGLHPNTAVRLTASYSGKNTPTFYIDPSSENVRPMARGIQTFIIRNELS